MKNFVRKYEWSDASERWDHSLHKKAWKADGAVGSALAAAEKDKMFGKGIEIRREGGARAGCR